MSLNRSTRRTPAGFTLVELLLVLVIAATIMALVGTSLSRSVSGAEARAAAREVMAGLRQTRTRAILDKTETVFEVDTEARTWQAAGREPVTLPDGVDIRLTTARSELTGEGAGGIRFFPDGGATGGEVDLVIRGREYAVKVTWLTGEAFLEVGDYEG